MTRAVFLSAGIPDPSKKHFVDYADAIDVTAAVRAFVYAVLGRRHLVWGGHPAITPMVWAISNSMGIDYGQWVTLYQSRFFEDRYPEDNTRFENVRYIDAVPPSPGLSNEDRLNESVRLMRRAMFTAYDFETAVFIGGMGGIVDEFEMFGKFCPNARRIPVLSTGGATGQLADTTATAHPEVDLGRLRSDVDYVPLFYDLCDIDSREPRAEPPEADTPGLEF